jgi:hypothetical protein
MSLRWQKDIAPIVQHKVGAKRWIVIDPVGRVCHRKYYEKQSYYRPPGILITDDTEDPSFFEVFSFKEKNKFYKYKYTIINNNRN